MCSAANCTTNFRGSKFFVQFVHKRSILLINECAVGKLIEASEREGGGGRRERRGREERDGGRGRERREEKRGCRLGSGGKRTLTREEIFLASWR